MLAYLCKKKNIVLLFDVEHERFGEIRNFKPPRRNATKRKLLQLPSDEVASLAQQSCDDALLRKSKSAKDTKLFCDDLMIDKEKTAVFCGQQEIIVSQPEYQILLILMENKGKTVTRRQLLEQVWDSTGNYVNDNTLTVTMKRLREKLGGPA